MFLLCSSGGGVGWGASPYPQVGIVAALPPDLDHVHPFAVDLDPRHVGGKSVTVPSCSLLLNSHDPTA